MTKYSNGTANLKFKDNPMQQRFDIAWKSTGGVNRYNKSIRFNSSNWNSNWYGERNGMKCIYI